MLGLYAYKIQVLPHKEHSVFVSQRPSNTVWKIIAVYCDRHAQYVHALYRKAAAVFIGTAGVLWKLQVQYYWFQQTVRNTILVYILSHQATEFRVTYHELLF